MKLNRAKKTGIPAPDWLGSPFTAPHPRMNPAIIAEKLQKFTVQELGACETLLRMVRNSENSPFPPCDQLAAVAQGPARQCNLGP